MKIHRLTYRRPREPVNKRRFAWLPSEGNNIDARETCNNIRFPALRKVTEEPPACFWETDVGGRIRLTNPFDGTGWRSQSGDCLLARCSSVGYGGLARSQLGRFAHRLFGVPPDAECDVGLKMDKLVPVTARIFTFIQQRS